MIELRPGDTRYPALLGAIPAPPPLFVRGELVDDDTLALAIVGSRRPTPYGLAVAERLASDLAARGVTIVSGLARGIDTAAHRGALAAGGRTLAVLGCGLDVVYPLENRALARAIEAQGALVSQFAPTGEQRQLENGSDEGRMFRLLAPDEPQHIEQLIARAGLDPARAAALLVTLELGGWARQLAGQRWVSLETRTRRA